MPAAKEKVVEEKKVDNKLNVITKNNDVNKSPRPVAEKITTPLSK